jgi:hypothetical protein
MSREASVSSEFPLDHAKVKDCKWSYERRSRANVPIESILFAQLSLTGAMFMGEPVGRATVEFGKPVAGKVGKLVRDNPNRLSITLPMEDLPGFAAAVHGPGPLVVQALISDSDMTVSDFVVKSEGFQ